MIAVYLDIETMGLDRHEHVITVISVVVEDTATEQILKEHTYNICLAVENGTENDIKRSLYSMLQACDSIVAYNGINFDIPFIVHWLSPVLEVQIATSWESKILDFYKVAEDQLHSRVGMQKMCQDNGMEISKSGTGLQAIQWARDREWEKLEMYCMQDVKVMLALTRFARTNIVIAKSYGTKTAHFKLREDMRCQVILASNATGPSEYKRARNSDSCEDIARCDFMSASNTTGPRAYKYARNMDSVFGTPTDTHIKNE